MSRFFNKLNLTLNRIVIITFEEIFKKLKLDFIISSDEKNGSSFMYFILSKL